MNPELMTIPQVLAYLKISRATYYRLVQDGTLQPRKVRQIRQTRVLIPRSEVEQILVQEFIPQKD